MTRDDGRRAEQLRPVDADPRFLEQPHGMVLWSQGRTRVLCTASVVENVPRWLYRSGRGWVTAEYSLLPASTGERTEREAARGRQGAYRFLTTGDPVLFASLGERFLQLPVGDVKQVSVAELERLAA